MIPTQTESERTAMTGAAVLLYNFTEAEVKSWRFLLRTMPAIKLVVVPKAAFGMSILDVLAGKEPPALCYGKDFSPQRMLVLANVPNQTLHFLLDVCGKVTKEHVLRAVLTETNGKWTASALCAHLQEEEDEIRRAMEKKKRQ